MTVTDLSITDIDDALRQQRVGELAEELLRDVYESDRYSVAVEPQLVFDESDIDVDRFNRVEKTVDVDQGTYRLMGVWEYETFVPSAAEYAREGTMDMREALVQFRAKATLGGMSRHVQGLCQVLEVGQDSGDEIDIL